MGITVEEAIARVPMWANANDLKVTPLDGGITNSNFRIDVGEESFALRIAGANTNLLGINREHEHAANLAAGKLGIAPEVIYVIQPEGYLVTRFISARSSSPKRSPNRETSAASWKSSARYIPFRKSRASFLFSKLWKVIQRSPAATKWSSRQASTG